MIDEYKIVDKNGCKCWYQNGIFHREDGPAIEWEDGTKKWLKNGGYHRLDGPAIEWINGSKEWWQNNQLHREDGPAREWNEYKEYWIRGIRYSKNHYLWRKNKLMFNLIKITSNE